MTRAQGQSRVYFLRPKGEAGPVKIGCSCAPGDRQKAFQPWCPWPIEIAAEIEGGQVLERRFHAKFREQWLNGEWFAASDELTATIAAIQAGTFDASALPEPRMAPRNRRNLAFLTPEFRYSRSADGRVTGLCRRGLNREEAYNAIKVLVRCDSGYWAFHDIAQTRGAEFDRIKAGLEALIADWQQRYPLRRHRPATPSTDSDRAAA